MAKRDDERRSGRGLNSSGVAPEANPPSEWSDTTNIGWKVEVPTCEVLVMNVLDEGCDELYLRGRRHLYSIGAP